MSNYKQSMKLYTEEHLKIFYNLGKVDGFIGRQDDVNELIKNYPTIELPSDEEIGEFINTFPYTKQLDDGQFNDGVIYGATIGIDWMRNKIQGGNK